MIIGGTLGGVSIIAVPFAPNIYLLIVALCVFGVAAAFLGTAPAAAVGDAAGGRSGTAVAIFSMCADIGAIIGPLVAGWLADTVVLSGGLRGRRRVDAGSRCRPGGSARPAPVDEAKGR